jgi:glucose-6-phosphate isomerase
MLYQHITEHCFTPANAAQGGISHASIAPLCKRLAPAMATLAARQNDKANPLLDITERTDDLEAIESLARDLRKRFSTIIIAGTGGSGLSGRTLTSLVPYHRKPGIHFLENIDPDMMDPLLARLDIEDTCFIVISKSGSTAETLSQFYALLEYTAAAMGRDKAREHFVVITQPSPSPLRDTAQSLGLTLLDHAPDIGGRFCILTNVGLLPAALTGLDIRAIRRGAKTVVHQLDTAKSPEDCYPAYGATLQYAFLQQGYPITVMLPYAERLAGFSSWYRQNWAESLGKEGRGSTPIRAIGTTDQHSQLQLYLDGPKDKLFHMIMLSRKGTGRNIFAPDRADLDYLKGKTLGDVMAAEQKATFESLIANQCPVRLFKLDVLNEEAMGALLMHFMLEIILTADLLEINPFDQPAVEEGKKLARDYLLKGELA